MKITKLALLVSLVISALVILVVSLTFSLYNDFVTLDHQKSFFDEAEKRDRANRTLLLKTGKRFTKAELLKIVEDTFGKEYVQTTDNTITVGPLILRFDKEVLAEVRNSNSPDNSR